MRGARILLVEDNLINQEIALTLLRRAGVVASVAGDGREALDMLARQSFDGVLMDCQMPILDGYDARACAGWARPTDGGGEGPAAHWSISCRAK